MPESSYSMIWRISGLSLVIVLWFAQAVAEDALPTTPIPGADIILGGDAPGLDASLPDLTPGPDSSAELLDPCFLHEPPPYVMSDSPLGNPSPFSWRHKPVWAWRYPLMASRHNGPVQALAFSADGRLALSGGWDRTTRLWDVAGGRQLRIFAEHDSWIKSVAFSPDGRLAIAGSYEGTTRVWDIISGREIQRFEGGARIAVFSPAGERVASAGRSGRIWLWDVNQVDPVAVLQGHKAAVNSLAFSADGCYLLSSGWDRSARLWNIATRREVHKFTHDYGGISSAALAPKNNFVATGDDWGNIHLWDVVSGTFIRSIGEHPIEPEPPNYVLRFLPDASALVASAGDGMARVIDLSSGTILRKMNDSRAAEVPVQVLRYGVSQSSAENLAGSALAVSHDTKLLLSGDGLGRVRLWDVSSGELLRCLGGTTERGFAELGNPDPHTIDLISSLLAVDQNYKSATLQDCASISEKTIARADQRMQNQSPVSSALQQAVDDLYNRNDVAARRALLDLAETDDPAAVMWRAYLQHGGLLGVARDQALARDQANTVFPALKQAAEGGEMDAIIGMGLARFKGFGIAEDRTQSAVWYRRAATLGSSHGKMIMGLLHEYGWGVAKDETQALAWFRDAAQSANANAMFKLGLAYERGTGVEKNDQLSFSWYQKATAAGHSQAMLKLSEYYRDGTGVREDLEKSLSWLRQAAGAGNRDAMVRVGGLYHRGEYVVRSDEQAQLWYRRAEVLGQQDATHYLEGLRRKRMAQKELAASLKTHRGAVPASINAQLVVQVGHQGYINAAVFSPDAGLIASAGADGSARLWDVASGQELRRFYGHKGAVNAIAFSPDGDLVLSAGQDQSLRLWYTASAEPIMELTHGDVVNAVAFSANGDSFFSAGDDAVVRRWDVQTGRLLREYTAHEEAVIAMALSADGSRLLTGGADKSVRLWDIDSAKPLAILQGHTEQVSAVAFSADGKWLISGDSSGEIRLWEYATAQFSRSFRADEGSVRALSFSADSRQFAAAGSHKQVNLWSLDSSAVQKRFEGVEVVSFTPSGDYLLTADYNTLRLWRIADVLEIQRYTGKSAAVKSVAVSADGKFILTSIGSRAALWDLETGAEMRRFKGHLSQVGIALFAPASPRIVTGGRDGSARIWDLYTGKELNRLFATQSSAMQRFGFGSLYSLALSPDGRLLLSATGMLSNNLMLSNIVTGESVRVFSGHRDAIFSVAYSSDGRFVLSGSNDGTARLWDVGSGRQLLRLDDYRTGGANLAFSSDNRRLAISTQNDGVLLWDRVDNQEVGRLATDSDAHVFSPDNQFLLSSSGGSALLWDIRTRRIIRRFETPSHQVSSVAITPDQKKVLTGGEEGVVKIWDFASGRELVSLISFADGSWAVVDPSGRFDTDHLDGSGGLHWVLPDAPYTPLPVEIFMREFYEPRLLPRILAGQSFAAVPQLQELNRVQPEVEIVSVNAQGLDGDRVTVNLRVKNVVSPTGRHSGVHDLRLFRNGQLVAYAPEQNGALALDAATGIASVRFADIRIPRDASGAVVFSAYAFNNAGIKSPSSRRLYQPERALTQRKGRVYLINIGINNYRNPTWNLTYAANDARLFQGTLAKRLAGSGQWREVIPVALISDEGGGFVPHLADKNQIKAVLEILAGVPVDPTTLGVIPGAERLQQAAPEDLVLVSFSSHGVVDGTGEFYFFPADIGPGRDITSAFLNHLISTDEMALWLRDVDAGEIVLIVDACHSAAAIAQEGFKPGPMASRGLGQMAYDKGMRILSASQADSFALESDQLRQGLLTYALLSDGLLARQADFQPQDRKVVLGEWLEYARRRVPVLNREILEGRFRPVGRGAEDPDEEMLDEQSARMQRRYQQPALFNYTHFGSEIVLQDDNL